MGRRSGRETRTRLGRRARQPTPRYRDAHIWYDAGSKQNFTAYKLLFTDIANGRQVAVPRAIMAAGNIMKGSRGGTDLPEPDITRVKNHLAKYYKKMGETAPGSGTDDAAGARAAGPCPQAATRPR